jgi:hypothetical protein
MARATKKKLGLTFKTKAIIALGVVLGLVVCGFKVGPEDGLACVKLAGHGICVGIRIE